MSPPNLFTTLHPRLSRARLDVLDVILLEKLRRRLPLSRDQGGDLLVPLVLVLAELGEMHLIRSICQLQRTDTSPRVCKRGILAHTSSTKRLHGTVDDRKSHVGHEDLSLGNLAQRRLRSAGIDLDGSVEDDEACSIDFDTAASDPLEDHTVLLQLLAERRLLWVVDAHQHPVESVLGSADAAHGVVDTSWAETALDDLETAAGAEDDLGDWDAHVLEGDVRVSVGGVIVTVHGEHAVDGDTLGGGGDEDHGLLAVLVLVCGVGLGHDNVYGAARIAGTRRPPFLSRVS